MVILRQISNIMVSGIQLATAWLFVAAVLLRLWKKKPGRDVLLPIAFVLASTLQFAESYWLIPAIRNPTQMTGIIVVAALILCSFPVLLPTWRRGLPLVFKEFFFPCLGVSESGSAANEKHLINLRVLLVAAAFILILITQMLLPTVHSWDSHWYNLSRIPAMLLMGSTFPEESPVLLHSYYPLAHDLLYLIDILMANLRGMGLIVSMELFVTLGCLSNIAISMLAKTGMGGSGIRTQIALLLTTILLLSSDLQVLQSTEPKNDMVVTMCFAISAMLAISTELKKSAYGWYLLFSLTTGLYAIASKSYGAIAMTPTLVAIAIDGLTVLRGQAIASATAPDSSTSSFAGAGKKIPSTRADRADIILIAILLLAALFLWLTTWKQSYLVSHSQYRDLFAQIPLDHGNLKGSILERMHIFILNCIRNAVSFISYPYSTLLKFNATRDDDFLIGFGPLRRIIYDRTGLLNNPPIVRWVKSDSAHGSIFLMPMIAAVFALILRKRLPRLRMIRREIIIPTLSCLLSFFLLSFVLLGQSFGSKYMGTTYTNLIPLVAVAVASLDGLKIVSASTLLTALTLAAFLRFSALINIGSIPTYFNNLFTNPASLAITQSSDLFHFQIVGSSLSPQKARERLVNFEKLPTDKVNFFCYEPQSPTLIPLMHAVRSLNQPDPGKVFIRFANNQQCNAIEKQTASNPGSADTLYLP